MENIKLVQSVVAIFVCAMATFAAAGAEIISGDALIGLYGAVIGYVFGDSTARRDARMAAEHVLSRQDA